METFGSLMRGDLPPVGRPIVFLQNGKETQLPIYEPYYSCWVDSGTSALALAFLCARSLRNEIVSPEIILPGYCCPDLVAAAHYAGLSPVIIDISVDDPALNQAILRSAISEKTIAVVAVNFLGVAENLEALLGIKAEYPHLFIIEDNAQWFPNSDAGELGLLQGDFVIFSFGRGKPVSLLGGGLLLSKYELSESFLRENIKASHRSESLLEAKYFAYNHLLKPFFYQFISRNPFISLGQTRYSSLDEIVGLDAKRSAFLAPNLRAYNQFNVSNEVQYDVILNSVGFKNMFNPLNTHRRRRLLRYPVLFESIEQKERVLARLIKLGLGATEMYRVALFDIEGVKNISLFDRLENAVSFASRFITLPTHTGVSAKHIELIGRVFSD